MTTDHPYVRLVHHGPALRPAVPAAAYRSPDPLTRKLAELSHFAAEEAQQPCAEVRATMARLDGEIRALVLRAPSLEMSLALQLRITDNVRAGRLHPRVLEALDLTLDAVLDVPFS